MRHLGSIVLTLRLLKLNTYLLLLPGLLLLRTTAEVAHSLGNAVGLINGHVGNIQRDRARGVVRAGSDEQ